MQTKVRNIFAILCGIVSGSLVNMALVMIGPGLIPPPDGVDMSSTQSIAQSVQLLQPKHFLFPFLAHSLGTLSGALTAYLLSGSYRVHLGYTIGIFFLIGGIAASYMIPAPLWFVILDLLLAYIPMAWLAIFFGKSIRNTGTVKI